MASREYVPSDLAGGWWFARGPRGLSPPPPPGSGSDAEYVVAYKRNIQAIDASGFKFDLVTVTNWTPHPSRNLARSALRQPGERVRDGDWRRSY
jgi:hypothetical protein